MVSERERRYKEQKQKGQVLTDSAIVDLYRPMLQGSKDYHDRIIALTTTTTNENKSMILYVKHYDLPVEVLDPIWYYKEAEKYLLLLSQAVREVYEDVHKDDYEFLKDIDHDKIGARLVIDDDKLLTSIRDIKTKLLDDLVVFDGVIVSKSDVQTAIDKARYRCNACGIIQDNYSRKCQSCNTEYMLEFSRLDSDLIDVEYIIVQELQNDMKTSFNSIPEQKEILIKSEDLINKFKPGQTVRVTGFVKPKMMMSEEKLRKKKISGMVDITSFDLIIEAHNIQYKETPQEIILQHPETYITDLDKKRILSMRKKYNDTELLNILVNSFAPKIYGMQNQKQAILLQAVGPGFSSVDDRDWINILIVGDPGIGKSKLLEYAAKINLHSARVVGKGASGVGITASVIKDDKGRNRLAIGPAVLADGGVCIIDELSNISEEHQAHLLECMESGSFTVTKGGINQKLNTRAAYLVATNPDSGKYSTYNNLTENVKISPPLLSRFDIIFVVVDNVNIETDQKIRVHVMAKINKKEPPKQELEESTERWDEDFLRKWVVYARIQTNFIPIPEVAYKRLDSFHKDLRKPVRSSDITAGIRQYEGIARIAKAVTRLLLKTEVDQEIAEFVIKFLNSAYESTGMKLGNSTGLNQTMLFSKDITKMSREKAFIEIMKLETEDNTKPVDSADIIFALEKHLNITRTEADELLTKMDQVRKVLLRPLPHTYLLDTSSYHIY